MNLKDCKGDALCEQQVNFRIKAVNDYLKEHQEECKEEKDKDKDKKGR